MARLSSTLILLLLLVGASAHATGDFYDEVIPTLISYLDRLPSKSLAQVHADTRALQPPGEPVDLEKSVASLVKDVEGRTALSKLVGKVDLLLEKARRAQADTGPMPVNLLHDLRDALASGAKDRAELAGYLQFRLSIDDELRSRGATKPLAVKLDGLARAASPELRPQYLYLQGAIQFLGARDDTESQNWFERVVKEHPGSPRAEAALFMMGRCQISRSRRPYYTQRGRVLNQDQRPAAKKLLDRYLRAYPEGRFAGDALGWLGAYSYDGGDHVTALQLYIQQAELPGHPELTRPALIMAEKCLGYLAADLQDRTFAEIARHPRFAMGLAYWLLNTSESDDHNGAFDEPAAVRTWRRKILPRLGKALADGKERVADEEWEPRYVAMLALATSGAGRHEAALKLLDAQGRRIEKTDDGLFADGIVAARAGNPKRAIAAFRRLAADFPSSPLVRGSRLRLALALADDHQSGAAIVELKRVIDDRSSSEEDAYDTGEYPPDRTLASLEQTRQLIDALWNFAPVEELEAVVPDDSVDPGLRQEFRQVIAQRHLARERFDRARPYMAPPDWERHGQALEKLTAAAGSASTPDGKAAACLALAEEWAKLRGQLLTVPLDTSSYRADVFSEGAKANDNRAVNAQALGVSGNPGLELENRDELRHAFNWWLEASDAAPGTQTAATALWHALRAMPFIAKVSPFTIARAHERKWSNVSRALHDRLKRESPDTDEARLYAVHWTFPAPRDEATPSQQSEQGGQGAWNAGGQDARWNKARDLERITADAVRLEQQAGLLSWAVFRDHVEALRDEAVPVFTDLNSAFLINFLDDLHAFTAGADPGPVVRSKYVGLRVELMRCSAWFAPSALQRPAALPEGVDPDEVLKKRIAEALTDPAMKPIADFAAFLELALIANHTVMIPFTGADKDGEPYSYPWRDYPLLVEKASRFLADFPKSAKREAALLVKARAKFMAARPGKLERYTDWPQADTWFGGTETLYHQRVAFEPQRIHEALDDYEKQFPGGRYAPDIRNLRAAALFREHKLKPALALTLDVLGDDSRPDLHGSAADRLEEIFVLLADEKERAPLLDIIKADPRARSRLDQYLGRSGDAHPLASLRDWLRDRLN